MEYLVILNIEYRLAVVLKLFNVKIITNGIKCF